MSGQVPQDFSKWPPGDSGMAARVRDFDWAATPLGAVERWPQSLRTVIDIMLASSSMMSLVWGADAIHLYNDHFTELLREHQVTALGRSAFETFARSLDVFGEDVAAGMAGRSARLIAQRYPVLRQGVLGDAWFDVDYAPVRDETGAVAGVLWTLKEVTAQVLAECALRESEARHRLLIGSWAQAVWETDAGGVVVTDSPSWRAYTGQTVEQWLGYGWLDAIHPDDRAYAERQWRDAISARGFVDTEFRLSAPDGGWRWTNVRAAPVFNAAGQIDKWVGMNIDADVRKRAEAAMRESEARQRTLMEGIPQLVWRSGDEGQWTSSSPQWQTFTGQNEAESRGLGWLEAIHPDDREVTMQTWRKARDHGMLDVEHRVRRASDNVYVWHHTRSMPVRDDAGVIVEWLGTTTDIQQMKELQERQAVLVDELQHRTRNLLGVVRSMVDKTARSSTDLSDFRPRFRERLESLARVQGLLSRLDDIDRVTFGDLIRTELSAMNGGLDRVVLDGPAGVRLRSSTVQMLAMALHELATNAVKYGALGQANGQLAITWSLEQSGTDSKPWLHIDWKESGVAMPPAGSAPQGTGQGRELIERALPYQLRARTSYRLGSDGVHCTISIPIFASNEVPEHA